MATQFSLEATALVQVATEGFKSIATQLLDMTREVSDRIQSEELREAVREAPTVFTRRRALEEGRHVIRVTAESRSEALSRLDEWVADLEAKGVDCEADGYEEQDEHGHKVALIVHKDHMKSR